MGIQMMDVAPNEELKCLNPGCGKKYKESENTDTSCHFHDGKPIFHDVKKGWTCCNKLVYDWDEFQKLIGCKDGRHSNVKKDTQFFKSSTVANAQKGIDNQPQPVQTMPQPVANKSIEDYQKEQKIKEEEKKKAEMAKPKVLVKDKDGKTFCSNPGCSKRVFDFENNCDDVRLIVWLLFFMIEKKYGLVVNKKPLI